MQHCCICAAGVHGADGVGAVARLAAARGLRVRRRAVRAGIYTCCNKLHRTATLHLAVRHDRSAPAQRRAALPSVRCSTALRALQRSVPCCNAELSAQDAPAWLDRARDASGFAVSAEAHLAVVGINCTLLAPTVLYIAETCGVARLAPLASAEADYPYPYCDYPYHYCS